MGNHQHHFTPSEFTVWLGTQPTVVKFMVLKSATERVCGTLGRAGCGNQPGAERKAT